MCGSLIADGLRETVDLSLQPGKLANQGVGHKQELDRCFLLLGTQRLGSGEPKLDVAIQAAVEPYSNAMAYGCQHVPKSSQYLVGDAFQGAPLAGWTVALCRRSRLHHNRYYAFER